MSTAKRHVAIVGGGTAGWLAALMLRKAAPDQGALRVSVIESPNIPTVGVGEGSTSIFRQVLMDLGIDEAEFIAQTGATLKFGIKHGGWRRDGKDYFGPIDDPNALRPAPVGLPTNWLHHARLAAGKPVSNLHLFTYLMRQGKSAVAQKDGKPIALSPYHHAYHFDQAKLGRFLSTKAQGVNHLRTEVLDLERNENGEITALLCSDDERVPVDFVMDCTGFRRAIVGKMGAKFRSYRALLPLNKAMPFWLDHADSNKIPNYTLAQAMNAGWMWGIPVQGRMGCGYVFSDAHVSPDEAKDEIEARLRHPIGVRRIIDIDPGRLENAWIGNCCAIGLSQSFLEPLEATSIHGSLVQLILLLQTGALTGEKPHSERVAQNYNMTVARQVDEFADFINLHYAGGRTDTDFWRDMTADGIAPSQRARIEHWQSAPMTRDDFTPLPGALPHVEEQLHMPVMAGLGLLPTAPSKAVFSRPGAKIPARKTADSMEADFKSAAARAMTHTAFLELCNGSLA